MGSPGQKADSKLERMLAEAVSLSGFPFQAKIRTIIEDVPEWEIVGTECSWAHGTREEFLDIVARKQNVHLVIECKRVGILHKGGTNHGIECHRGAPKRSYIFLCEQVPGTKLVQTSDALVTYCLEPNEDGYEELESGAQATVWRFAPPSYEASLCITFDVNGPRNMLEREVADLVRGTHEYANTLYSLLWSVGAHITEVFLPVYVTTAPLFALELDPRQVSEINGECAVDPESLKSVPWMRFSKSFMARGTPASDDRTVIIVQAQAFKEFLEGFKVLAKEE